MGFWKLAAIVAAVAFFSLPDREAPLDKLPYCMLVTAGDVTFDSVSHVALFFKDVRTENTFDLVLLYREVPRFIVGSQLALSNVIVLADTTWSFWDPLTHERSALSHEEFQRRFKVEPPLRPRHSPTVVV
jgi:hypothetical protein